MIEPARDINLRGATIGSLPSNLGTALGIELPAWFSDALCAQTDPDAFFPEKGGDTSAAKAICARCTVRDQCLEYALADDRTTYCSPFWFGIWGGLSPKERARLKRQRRAEA